MKVYKYKDYKEPIVIFGYPRSGTSMIARLFYLHGVWAGTCNSGVKNIHPNGKFEHKYLGKQGINFIEDVNLSLKNDNYQGGFWLVKRKINQSRINKWLNNGFNPYFILVRRDPEDIVASRWKIYNYKKHLGEKPKNYPPNEYQGIAKANKLMDFLRDNHNGMDVHSDLLIKSDYTEIIKVFNKIGIPFDSTIADNHIRKDLWKRKNYLLT